MRRLLRAGEVGALLLKKEQRKSAPERIGGAFAYFNREWKGSLFAGDAVRVIGVLDNKAGESEQRNGVGNDHEIVEHIA